MNRIKYLFVATLLFVLSSCDKDDEQPFVPTLEFAADRLPADVEGGILSIDVRADVPYEVVMPQDADWLKLTENVQALQSNIPSATLSFEVEKILSGNTRTAEVIIQATEISIADTLHIIQSGLADDADITAQFDPEFARCLVKDGSIPDAQRITYDDVKDIRIINLLFYGTPELTSIRGIEYCTSLTTLDCKRVKLATLDVSHNLKLKQLRLGFDEFEDVDYQLTGLNVSHNTELEDLDCANAGLTSLDVSRNTKLRTLNCAKNQLTHIKLNNCSELEYFNANDNEFSVLDISKNTNLKQLVCSPNKLTSLDLSKNTELTELSCSHGALTSLDINHNTKLEWLYCDANQLTSLDVSHCPQLKYLFCSRNRIASLDVSRNPKLKLLLCFNNRLASLDLNRNTKLESLNCEQNLLPGVDISSNRDVKYLYCMGNPGQENSFVVTVWPGCEVKVTDGNSNPVKEITSWEYDGQPVTVKYLESKE